MFVEIDVGIAKFCAPAFVSQYPGYSRSFPGTSNSFKPMIVWPAWPQRPAYK